MKISLIGTGKTGGQLLDLLPSNAFEGVFNSSTPLDLSKIDRSDACIIFIPGSSFTPLIPQLMTTSTPMVIGATGFEWEEEHLRQLKTEMKRWVHGHNFSLLMILIRHFINTIHKARNMVEKMSFHIHETHHKNKKDAPSGTALLWKEWLNAPSVKMTYDRIEDAIGTHQLTVKGSMEQFQITHETLDRKVFALGALWAAQRLQDDRELPVGLINFEDLVDFYIENSVP